MALENITKVTGQAVYVPGNDIDTDRIIPARYMKVVTFDGLGEYMFRDVRIDANGNRTDHVLNQPEHANASIMVVDSNFGCGSSREHAPQAIRRAGFNAIIGESFAEIFYGNSITLGMPCVETSAENVQQIAQAIQADPATEITIDIENETVSFNDTTLNVSIKSTAKDALINGRWDPIVELLDNDAAIDKTAQRLPYINS